ncbi:MAG TPA: hypothetical protein DIT01_12400 [Lentisphaeria bacterium]|nr:hypothetical protein [Lentisphaeria bacterium]
MPATDLPDHLQLLTIAAHPHDVTYTLGTSAHHIERGDKVTVVSLTDGVTTHDETLEDELRKPEIERQPEILERSHDELADRKKHEMERVCGLFGITDVRILPFADQPIEVTPELHSTLADIFYELRPHIVITHAPFNYPHHNMSSLWNNDHSVAGRLSMRPFTVSPRQTVNSSIRRIMWRRSTISVSSSAGRTSICSWTFPIRLPTASRPRPCTSPRAIPRSLPTNASRHLRDPPAGGVKPGMPNPLSARKRCPVIT